VTDQLHASRVAEARQPSTRAAAGGSPRLQRARLWRRIAGPGPEWPYNTPKPECGGAAEPRQAAPHEVSRRRPLPQPARRGNVAVDERDASAGDSSPSRLPGRVETGSATPTQHDCCGRTCSLLREASVASHESSDRAARADVLVCQGAVQLSHHIQPRSQSVNTGRATTRATDIGSSPGTADGTFSPQQRPLAAAMAVALVPSSAH
jgi:hypothetical protein